MEETTWSALGAPGSVAMREKAGLLPDRHKVEDEVDGDVDEDGVELDGKGLLTVRATMTPLVAGSWSLEAGPGAGAAGDCTSMAGKAGSIVEKTKSSRCCWLFFIIHYALIVLQDPLMLRLKKLCVCVTWVLQTCFNQT